MRTEPLWIYLDQNKWIDLDRAYYSHPGGTRFNMVLNRIEEAIQYNRAMVPVSADNIVEIVKQVTQNDDKDLPMSWLCSAKQGRWLHNTQSRHMKLMPP